MDAYVRGATGEPEAVGDIRRDSGTDRDIEGAEGPTDELGADAWRDVVSGELRSGGDPQLHDEVAQQRLDASAAKLKSCMERVISSLTVLGNDESVYDSGIVKVTREVVEALEPIVSSLEGQPVAVPPKRDLTSAMARVINGLTAMDSEDVFGESEIIAEIKSLVERVEAHTIAQEQLTQHINPGEHHVRQNSSRESHRVSRDPGRVRNATAERTGADLQPSARADGQDRQLAGVHRESSQKTDDTQRGQKRYLPDGGESREPGRAQLPDATQPTELTRSNGSEARPADRLQRIADTLVRVRLQRELAEPMARLRELLEASAQLERSNQEKQASISAKLQQYLAQAKVEVLDTTLTEWRSLRQEPELHQIPELAVAPSDRAELTSLIANYPAQKVIEYAMAEYAQVRQHSELGAIGEAKHQAPASATKLPTPRTDSPPKPKQSAAPGRTVSLAKPSPRPQQPPTPRPEKRVPVVAFWQPDYAEARRPDLLEPEHWEEFKRSAIHPDLVQLNVSSLEGQPVLERLLDEKLGSLSGDANQYATEEVKRIVKPYERVAEGGWWGTAGIDAKSLIDLQPGEKPQQSLWGVFKPDKPILEVKKPLIRYRYGETDIAQKVQRQNTESLSVALLMAAGINANKFIEYRPRKYENPAGTERHLYLPNVPDEIAQRIYAKHDIQPTEAEQQSGFWSVVASHPEIPIVVTEGFKKTLSSLSQGEVTIGLAGVNALYRARGDDKEKLPERQLNAEMAIFATPGRRFTFAYDSDSKTSTVFNVRAELVRGVELLEARGSDVRVSKWKPELGKGLDDLVVNQGPTAYAAALSRAESAEREKRLYYRTQYNALSKEVRKAKPDLAGVALDIEVYLLAITKGELKDGERFLSQSDQARTLKTPEEVTAYIDHIKAQIPQYLQQQRELAAAQAQLVTDRADYELLAQRIRKTPVKLSDRVVDMQVFLIAEQQGTPGDGDRLIAQSDHARSLASPQEAQAYVTLIRTEAPTWFEQAINATSAKLNRETYERLSQQVTQVLGDIPTEQLDMEVCLKAKFHELDTEGILTQSDHALSLHDKQTVSAYVEHIKAEAPLYLQRMSEQLDRANHRRLYEELTDAIQQENSSIQPAHSDMEVYLRAEARGLGGESILAQSNSALSLSNPDQAQAYVDRIIAEAPLYSQQKQERAAVQAQHEQELADSEANTTATASSQNDPMPVQVSEQRPVERLKPIRAITEPQKAQQKVDQAVASIKQELRAQYDDIAQQVKSKLGEVPPEIVDLEVYLKTKNPDQAKRLIHVGDKMTALTDADSDFTDSYSDAIAQVAPAYDEIKNNPNAKLNHRMMVAIVNNTTAQLQLQKSPEPNIHRKKEREDELML